MPYFASWHVPGCKNVNVLLLGPPGVGKTPLSIALGREAILAITTATTLVAGSLWRTGAATGRETAGAVEAETADRR
jgi:adenylate kinase family enzyme